MTLPLSRLVRPGLLDIAPYVPGKPLESLQRAHGVHDIIRFASNENAFGASPRAIEAMRRAAGEMHRYADAGCLKLRERIAEHVGVTPAHVMPTCGSNEMILLACQAFLAPGDEVLLHFPSFLMYPIAVRGAGGIPVAVPGGDFGIDLDALLAAVTPRTRMVFVCSPNNPTGDIVTAAALDRFLAALPPHVVVMLDEAYHEFVADPDYPDGVQRMLAHPDRAILVLHTFSKAHALASLRVGYGVMQPELVQLFERIRQPFNINGMAQAAAIASLEDTEQVQRSVQATREAMGPLAAGLRALGVHVRDSHANFLFCRFPSDTRPLCAALEQKGLIVRPLTAFGLDDTCTRITVGRPDENARLLAALRSLLPSATSPAQA